MPREEGGFLSPTLSWHPFCVTCKDNLSEMLAYSLSTLEGKKDGVKFVATLSGKFQPTNRLTSEISAIFDQEKRDISKATVGKAQLRNELRAGCVVDIGS